MKKFVHISGDLLFAVRFVSLAVCFPEDVPNIILASELVNLPIIIKEVTPPF
jgi:hypothetical protein